MTELRIGFIGLGNMGGRMTKAITKTGRAVLGFDVVTDNIAAGGAKPAASVAEVTDGSDIVLLSLPDSRRSSSRSCSATTACSHTPATGRSSSTSAPRRRSRRGRIAARLAAKGASYLDAGISGGAAAAEKAALTLMVGGDEAALERARPVLDFFAAEIYYMGESGNGHTTKLLNNFLNAVNLTATAEVMVAGKKAGLDLATAARGDQPQLGRELRVAEPFSEDRQRRLPRRRPDLGPDAQGRAALHRVRRIARRRQPQLVGADRGFGLAARLGYAQQISNRVVDAIGDVSGGVRLHDPEADPDKAKEQTK